MAKGRFFVMILSVIHLSCQSENQSPFHFEDVKSQLKIWDSNKYSAFTDLVVYDNIYYCCFREGNGHMTTSAKDYGKIRILSSFEGTKWESVILIEDSNFDLRDPKLEVTTDGRLQLLVGCSSFDEKGQFNFRKTRVSFCSGDFSDLSNLKELELGQGGRFNHLWLWRSVWYNSAAYGVAYLPDNKPILLKSEDGLKYDEITQFDLPTSCNESGITFRSNGNMVIVIRDNYSTGFVAESESPYTDWNWHKLEQNSQSPTLLSVDDYVFLAIRNLSKHSISLQYMYPNFIEINNLYDQSLRGDMGYPGLVDHDGKIVMSYYENGKIFIASFLKKDIFNRINNSLNVL